jgi:hypothetical protein
MLFLLGDCGRNNQLQKITSIRQVSRVLLAMSTGAAGLRRFHAAMSACWIQPRRHGPPGWRRSAATAVKPACRLWGRRQVHAGFGPGGKWHVSLAQMCRHRGVVFFDKNFHRGSFLAISWRRWFLLSKILPAVPVGTIAILAGFFFPMSDSASLLELMTRDSASQISEHFSS